MHLAQSTQMKIVHITALLTHLTLQPGKNFGTTPPLAISPLLLLRVQKSTSALAMLIPPISLILRTSTVEFLMEALWLSSASNGEAIWTYPIDSSVTSPIIANDTVYVVSGDGSVYAFNTGRRRLELALCSRHRTWVTLSY